MLISLPCSIAFGSQIGGILRYARCLLDTHTHINTHTHIHTTQGCWVGNPWGWGGFGLLLEGWGALSWKRDKGCIIYAHFLWLLPSPDYKWAFLLASFLRWPSPEITWSCMVQWGACHVGWKRCAILATMQKHEVCVGRSCKLGKIACASWITKECPSTEICPKHQTQIGWINHVTVLL